MDKVIQEEWMVYHSCWYTYTWGKKDNETRRQETKQCIKPKQRGRLLRPDTVSASVHLESPRTKWCRVAVTSCRLDRNDVMK